jgi:hypothetical protein
MRHYRQALADDTDSTGYKCGTRHQHSKQSKCCHEYMWEQCILLHVNMYAGQKAVSCYFCAVIILRTLMKLQRPGNPTSAQPAAPTNRDQQTEITALQALTLMPMRYSAASAGSCRSASSSPSPAEPAQKQQRQGSRHVLIWDMCIQKGGSAQDVETCTLLLLQVSQQLPQPSRSCSSSAQQHSQEHFMVTGSGNF